jgi:hypothetical protein
MTTPLDTQASLDLHAFLRSNGRLPRFGDAVPPWNFRGWLLSQVQLADFHPALPGRWQHYTRTISVGHLLDEPIPRVAFEERPGSDGVKMIERAIDLIFHRDGSWTAFSRTSFVFETSPLTLDYSHGPRPNRLTHVMCIGIRSPERRVWCGGLGAEGDLPRSPLAPPTGSGTNAPRPLPYPRESLTGSIRVESASRLNPDDRLRIFCATQ